MKPGDQVTPERRQPNPKGSLRRMVGALHRCSIATGGLYLFALLALWGAWVYVRHGGDAFETWFLARIEEGLREERPNGRLSNGGTE